MFPLQPEYVLELKWKERKRTKSSVRKHQRPLEKAFEKETVAYGKMIQHCYIEKNNIQLLNGTD